MKNSIREHTFAKKNTGYRWIEKDPVLALVQAKINESTLSFQEIERRGGPTVHTLNAWMVGNVRRPQHFSIAMLWYALGYREAIVDHSGEVIALVDAPQSQKPRQWERYWKAKGISPKKEIAT